MPTQFVFMTTVLLMALFLLALVYETSLHSEERVVWSAALEKSFYVAGGKQANEGIRKASGNKNISVNLLCGNVSAIPPFHNYWTVYVIAPEYNLLTCMVEKAMTTFRTAALCYLHGDDRFVTDNITISSATHESLFMTYCNYKDKFKDYDTIRYIEDSNGNEMAKFFDDILKKAGVPKYHRKVIGIEMGSKLKVSEI
ncbi:hypothetical protein Q1695_006845 [Nippostrongylus brasiliensis]|nr:hypothetical protein Q1695_006845 [Nippostrongylus brasiliensis]